MARLRPLAVLALAALLGGCPAADQTEAQVVSVYSAHAQDDIDALRPLFEAETGIRVEVVKAGSGQIAQRLAAEAENPQADVIWSIAGDQLEANAELLEPAASAGVEGLEPAFLVSDKWLPYTGLVMVIVVNTELVPEGERPSSWADLQDPQWQDQIVSARAESSGSAYMQLNTILAALGQGDEEAGWQAYEAILANCVLSPSSSAVPKQVYDGEAKLGITLEDAARRYIAEGAPLAIVYPSEGTCTAPDGVALVKGARHPAAARAFVRWALSQATQDVLVERIGRRPVRPDASVPQGLPPLGAITSIPYDFQGAAAAKEVRVKRWQELAAKLGK